MKLPQVTISWGELFDKITILEIKLENLREVNALKNVKLEHDQLYMIYNQNFYKNENADIIEKCREQIKQFIKIKKLSNN